MSRQLKKHLQSTLQQWYEGGRLSLFTAAGTMMSLRHCLITGHRTCDDTVTPKLAKNIREGVGDTNRTTSPPYRYTILYTAPDMSRHRSQWCSLHHTQHETSLPLMQTRHWAEKVTNMSLLIRTATSSSRTYYREGSKDNTCPLLLVISILALLIAIRPLLLGRRSRLRCSVTSILLTLSLLVA